MAETPGTAYIAAHDKGTKGVVVRFAPSPTGFLHIGGARTALFNWLYARHHQKQGEGGTFRLRIEDTDRQRSTPEAVAAIIDGLSWLGLDWDGEIVHQFARAARHAEVARELLRLGRAYHCYCTPAELEAMREKARAEKRSVRYDGTWRDRDPAEAPPGIAPVIRLRAPQDGATTIRDLVQGEVTVSNAELDDLILLRADGTPTYNLSVVVDDHDMGITHVIRGDDHLNNAFRQTQIYRALDWQVPRIRACAADPRRRRREDVEAARRDRRRAVPRPRLSAGGAAQLSAAARLEPRRRRDHRHRRRDTLVRHRGCRARRGAVRSGQARQRQRALYPRRR